MDDRETAAILACLIETLTREAPGDEDTLRIWPASGHPHLDSWAWHPQGPNGWRMAGRMALQRARRIGRF